MIQLKKFNIKNNIILLLIITSIFSLDRILKIKIINGYNENKYFLTDFLNIDLIWNTGIGFGLLSSNSLLFYNLVTFLVGIVIIILFIVAITSKLNDKIIFSIIIGGAIGNFYDRLIYNAVPDFIDLHYNNFHWFTFNIADIFITIGVIFFLMKGYLIKNLTND
jgi:signal peptidase II